jgi:hypothetical protein
MINEHDNFNDRHQHDEVRWRPAFECVGIVFPVTVMWEHFIGEELNEPEDNELLEFEKHT